MSISQPINVGAHSRPKTAAKPATPLHNYFYLFMSLLIAAAIVYGFSHTVDKNLIHPTPARPAILYLHAVVFTSWLIFYIFQSLLVRTRNVRIHKQVGWFGVALVVCGGLTVSVAHFVNRRLCLACRVCKAALDVRPLPSSQRDNE